MPVPEPAPEDHPVDPDHPHPLTAAPGEDRILTVPNALTLGRLLGLPVFLWLLFAQENRLGAAIFLAVIAATDFVDGYIARHFDQASRLGKLFDPTADRILFFVAVTAIVVDGSAPTWVAVVVLVREAIVSAITVTLVGLGYPPVDVTWWGKAGTFLLMFAFPLFLAGSDPAFEAADVVYALGWVAAVPGMCLSLFAAVRYVPLWRESVREGRVLRAEAAEQAPPT